MTLETPKKPLTKRQLKRKRMNEAGSWLYHPPGECWGCDFLQQKTSILYECKATRATRKEKNCLELPY